MSKSELEALAIRCEQATGPDKYIDRAICNLLQDDDPILTPDFTASLDAAMTLAGDDSLLQCSILDAASAACWNASAKGGYLRRLPAYICAASLRAIAQGDDNEPR